MADLDKTIEEIGGAVAALKKANEEQFREIKEKGVADPILTEKVEKLHDRLAELDEVKSRQEEAAKLADRVGEMEVALDRIGTRKGEAGISEEQKAHFEAFKRWASSPTDAEYSAELKSIERKTVATTTDAAGGYAVPEVISTVLDEKIQDISPLRQIVDVVSVTTPDYKELVDVNGESFEWVGEGGTRSQQTEPTLAEAAPTFGTVNAYYWANEEAIDDMFVGVQGWLTRAAARAFARAEGAAFVSGNGTNKPTGFLNSAPVTTGDEDSPARAFGTVQYFPTGAAGAFLDLSTSSPVAYPDNVLVDTVHGLKSGYWTGATWLMNRATMGVVRKFRDADGRMLWQDSMAAGLPPTLLGFPVVEFPDMPAIAANSHSIAFGNFREAYLFAERHGTRVTVDQVTKPGAVKWNIRRRVGGILRNDDAIKVIKFAAS